MSLRDCPMRLKNERRPHVAFCFCIAVASGIWNMITYLAQGMRDMAKSLVVSLALCEGFRILDIAENQYYDTQYYHLFTVSESFIAVSAPEGPSPSQKPHMRPAG